MYVYHSSTLSFTLNRWEGCIYLYLCHRFLKLLCGVLVHGGASFIEPAHYSWPFKWFLVLAIKNGAEMNVPKQASCALRYVSYAGHGQSALLVCHTATEYLS